MIKNFEREKWDDFEKCLLGRKLILFGASTGCNKFFRDYREKYPVFEIYDNNKMKWGSTINGFEIKNPNEILKWKSDEVIVLITSTYVNAISQQLLEFEITNYFSFLFLRRQGVNWSIEEKDMNEINYLRNILYDDKSKYILDQLLYRRKNELVNYCDIEESNQYFVEGIFVQDDYEVFIDGGAYNGDTINNFIRWVGHYNYKIFAIEPEFENYNRLNILYSQNEKIESINVGLWSNEQKQRFYCGEGMESTIGSKGNIVVNCNSIDNLIEERVTFIKMDIEGSEMEALKGAKETILKWNPKLAISIYHKRDDLWRIPLYIHKLVPKYKLYIRHHNCDMAETVIYASI